MEGNRQKMREALVKIRRELNSYCDGCTLLDRMTEDPPDYTCLRDSLLEIERIVAAALAAPARQCDIGTADEQDARFSRYCVEKRSGSCSGCPDAVGGFTVANGIRECALVWAQTPYDAEKGGKA